MTYEEFLKTIPADFDYKQCGMTPLHILTDQKDLSVNEYETIVKGFIQAGGDVNASFKKNENDDFSSVADGTALHFCFDSDPINIDLAKVLVRYGASLESVIEPKKNQNNVALSHLTKTLTPIQLGDANLNFKENNLRKMSAVVPKLFVQQQSDQFKKERNAFIKISEELNILASSLHKLTRA